jgi:hypothetical protein
MNHFDRFYKHQRIFKLLDRFNIKTWHWIILSILFAGADFFSGPTIHFPILYILPVAMAGWGAKRYQALLLAVVLPSTRLILRVIWDIPWIIVDSVVNVLIRVIVFLSIAYLVSFIKDLHILRGFLKVCSFCGRVKNPSGNWISLHNYISNHSEALFSHGVCPECLPKLIEDTADSSANSK